MQRRLMKTAGAELPLLGFGMMRLPENEDKTINREKAAEMVDYALKNGVNYFDTAYGYHNGLSESFVGECLSAYPRSSFYIADKMPPWSLKEKGDEKEVFRRQLARLNTDHIDFYLLHSVTDDNFAKTDELGVYDYCSSLKKQGFIGHLGFSFHGSPAMLEKVLACGEQRGGWDFVQLQFNYLDYYCSTAKELYDILLRHSTPMTVMEPVRGGKLASINAAAKAVFDADDPSVSPSARALRWVADFDNTVTILSGMSTMEQLKENVDTLANFEKLTDAQRRLYRDAANEIRRIDAIPCTGCEYCVPQCPVGINIPGIFSDYNKFLETKRFSAFRGPYEASNPEGRRAVDCIACGSCAAACPQNIDIPSILANIAENTPEK